MVHINPSLHSSGQPGESPLASPSGPPALDDQPRSRALVPARSNWALADQATISLGNFLTGVALVRHLPTVQYGQYALVISLIYFLNNLHMSLVTYPLSMTTAVGDEQNLRRRTLRSVVLTMLLGIPFCLGIGTAATFLTGWSAAPYVMVALFCWQIQETMRRALLARLEHFRAIPGDAISYLGQAAVVWLVSWRKEISLPHTFAIIAATSSLAALVQAFQLRLFSPVEPSSASVPIPSDSVPAQAVEHWSIGRWVLFSNLVGLLSIYVTPWVLKVFHGDGEVAVYQALINLLGVTNPVLSSMANLIVPAVAKVNAERGLHASARVTANYSLQGAAILLPYFAILALMPGLVLRLVCGANSPYLIYSTQLRILVAVYAAYYTGQMCAGLLNGLGQTRWTFYGQFASAAANVLICVPLAAFIGLSGAVWAGLFPHLAQMSVCLYYIRSIFAHPSALKSNPTDVSAVSIPQAVAEGT